MGGKEEGCFLLEGKVQWGNQSIINYRNKCEVAPVISVIDEAMVVLRVYLMFIDRVDLIKEIKTDFLEEVPIDQRSEG